MHGTLGSVLIGVAALLLTTCVFVHVCVCMFVCIYVCKALIWPIKVLMCSCWCHGNCISVCVLSLCGRLHQIYLVSGQSTSWSHWFHSVCVSYRDTVSDIDLLPTVHCSAVTLHRFNVISVYCSSSRLDFMAFYFHYNRSEEVSY